MVHLQQCDCRGKIQKKVKEKLQKLIFTCLHADEASVMQS